MSQENNNQVYNALSSPNDDSNNESKANKKWTAFLIAACIVASCASFAFGYNIGVTNLPTSIVKSFYSQRYFSEFYVKEKEFNMKKKFLTSRREQIDAVFQNGTNTTETLFGLNNVTGSLEMLAIHEKKINETRTSVENGETMLWTLTTAIFVIGGAIGAFTSKYVAEFFGRKRGILFHYIFIVIGAVLTIISKYVNSPECIIIGRFLFGVQGGMSCGLIPTYLAEISPKKLRGATGVIHQLFITIGILISQVLGFREILGTNSLWHILLSGSVIPAIVGGILLLSFFPESPGALITKFKDEEEARIALQKLRASKNVSDEIENIKSESGTSKTDRSISIIELFTAPELRWPLLTGLVLQLTQQLCGINAVFFYSESIFKEAHIPTEYIQYAVVSTGLINVIATIIVVPLIDRLGRKPLLVFPMIVIIIDFVALTLFLEFKSKSIVLSYLSIACIGIFIICFAVGLGPIPFIYVAECFRQEARSTALAVCMFTNWFANLILSLTFPYLQKLISSYVFVIFAVIVAIALFVIFTKVPETKGRSAEEIMAEFDGRAAKSYEEASEKFVGNTNV